MALGMLQIALERIRRANMPLPGRTGGMCMEIMDRRHLRVLIVDDNHDTVVSMARLLRLWGHEPVEAMSGPEAIKMASSLQPDIIFLDLGMPGMSGLDIAKEIRQQLYSKRPAIIAYTGHIRPLHHQLVLEAGFDLMLLKPVHPELLKKVVDCYS